MKNEGARVATTVFPFKPYGSFLPRKPEFLSYLAQNLMQPSPYPYNVSENTIATDPLEMHVWKCEQTPAQSHMSLVVRKPVFGVSDQVRHKPGCTIIEDG